MAVNILQIPDAGPSYTLTGKKIMVHDESAPLASSTVLVPALDFKQAYSAPVWKETDGDMTIGAFTFVDSSLIGATEMPFIIVNKINETLDDDYTFDSVTGTITRTNPWQAGDKLITPHKPA